MSDNDIGIVWQMKVKWVDVWNRNEHYYTSKGEGDEIQMKVQVI